MEVDCCYCESVHIPDNNGRMVLLTLASLPLPLLQLLLFSENKLRQFVKKGVFNDVLRVALHVLFNMGLTLVRVLHDCIYLLSYKQQKQKETVKV